MNERKYLITKLVLSIIALIVVLSLIAIFFFSKNSRINIPFINGFIYSSSFNGEEINVNEDYSVSDINEISTSTAGIDLEIKEHDKDTVIFNFSSSNATIQYKQSDNTLYIEEIVPRFFNSISSDGTLTIYVPENSSYDYELNNVSGDVIIEARYINDIEIDSVSGDLKMYSTANSLDVNNVSGLVYSYSPINDVDINTVSGDIYITADKNTTDIEADSVSGSLTVNKIENLNFSIEFESLSGDIHYTEDNISIISYASGDINFNSVSGDLIFDVFE